MPQKSPRHSRSTQAILKKLFDDKLEELSVKEQKVKKVIVPMLEQTSKDLAKMSLHILKLPFPWLCLFAVIIANVLIYFGGHSIFSPDVLWGEVWGVIMTYFYYKLRRL